jgi:quinol monooxygenase YgiN
MLIVIVDFTVAPENEGLAQTTLGIEAPIARALAGNLGYSVWTDPDHPGKLRLMHEWTDTPSFDAYKVSAAFKSAGAVLFPLMIGKPLSRAFEASEMA